MNKLGVVNQLPESENGAGMTGLRGGRRPRSHSTRDEMSKCQEAPASPVCAGECGSPGLSHARTAASLGAEGGDLFLLAADI